MRIGIVAGEASGDMLGAGLMEALRSRFPDARFEGIGGPQMTAAGCRSLYPMERLAVMGLFEVAGRLLELIPVRRRLAKHFIADPPDAFVGIDAPDFNLALEDRLHRGGVRTAHYVSPSVWAWRRYRIHRIARAVDRMLVLFPFEERFYAAHGVPVAYVGHPLADRIREAPDPGDARRRLGLAAAGEVVALLPGSRLGEVSRLAAPMLGAAAWIARRRPGTRFVVPLATPAVRSAFEAVLRGHEAAPALTLVDARSRDALAAADVVLLASGTATLEALLLARPMVITYRMLDVTYRILERLVKLDHVGLPNLLAGRGVVPELLQDDATAPRLGAAVLALLERPALRAEMAHAFRAMRAGLQRDASARAAEAVAELVT